MTLNFDFITDDELRSVLMSDYREMSACADSKAWKAVHVLAGSIIEAVIADYLIAEGHVSRDEAMRLELSQSIALAMNEGILSEKLHSLSTVVKNYRNLVHPGRSIRFDEKPDENNSNIATTLVEMICKELGERKSSHGYTAEQVVGKIRRDSTAGAILQDMLRTDVSSKEIGRLLKKVIPETYYEVEEVGSRYGYEDDIVHLLSALKSSYRLAHKQADTGLRRDVASRFIGILKEEDLNIITIHIEAFWWMGQLEYLSDEDKQTAKRYFFSRIKQEHGYQLINALQDIGHHLLSQEVPDWIMLLVQLRCLGNKEAAEAAYQIMLAENWNMDEQHETSLYNRLAAVKDHYRRKGSHKLAQIVEETRNVVESPF